MTIEELKKELSKHIKDFEIIHHDKPILSKKDAEGFFNMDETAPTLIIKTNIGFFALIVSGERERINFENIKEILSCKKIVMADKKEIMERFDLIPGQIPLVGHYLPCIVDNLIFKHSFIYGGTGDAYCTLKIKPEDLANVNEVKFYFD
jgi:Cys-tRNA(Pro)/Cys-tRNA(Cys) deacylase